jgi:hypothetical protein
MLTSQKPLFRAKVIKIIVNKIYSITEENKGKYNGREDVTA